jgi:hypothetical protein
MENVLSFDAILAEVEAETIKTYEMSVLRDANGSSKLGSNIRVDIKNKLAEKGLSFIGLSEWNGQFSTEDLPDAAWKQVRLYKNGTYIASLISAVFELKENSAAADKLLAQFAEKSVEKKFEQVIKFQEKISRHQEEIKQLLNPNTETEGRT